MKKRLLLVLLVLAVVVSSIGCRKKDPTKYKPKETTQQKIVENVAKEDKPEDVSSVPLSERAVLYAATPGQHYPWNYFEGGELKGADLGVLEEACRRMGYEIYYEIMMVDLIHGAIDAGKVDTGA
jgi:ABC-type amino acid transport substrate-binding protein